MGGNALKDYETGRLTADDYFEFSEKFSDMFFEVFNFYPLLIRAFENKESFGDADYLVQADLLPPNWTEVLKAEFGLMHSQFVKNGNVVSIGYLNFQVDLIVTPKEDMFSSYFYFSYNDFGNLIGRIGHKLGIKIGHRGASLIVRHQSKSQHILGEIQLTQDFEVILDILGLSYFDYLRGFDELEDIFKFVASSKYFDPEIFSLEHRSNTSRVRDAKRMTYNKFLRWVADTKPKAHYEFGDKSELGGYSIRMPYYETEVLTRFPWVEAEVNTLIKDFEFEQRFKEVYNGRVVEELTGYTGKTLGAFMTVMKPRLTRAVKEEWIAHPSTMQLAVANLWANAGGINFNIDTN